MVNGEYRCSPEGAPKSVFEMSKYSCQDVQQPKKRTIRRAELKRKIKKMVSEKVETFWRQAWFQIPKYGQDASAVRRDGFAWVHEKRRDSGKVTGREARTADNFFAGMFGSVLDNERVLHKHVFHSRKCGVPEQRSFYSGNSFRALIKPPKAQSLKLSAIAEKNSKQGIWRIYLAGKRAVLVYCRYAGIDEFVDALKIGQRCWLCLSSQYYFQCSRCRKCLNWWCPDSWWGNTKREEEPELVESNCEPCSEETG